MALLPRRIIKVGKPLYENISKIQGFKCILVKYYKKLNNASTILIIPNLIYNPPYHISISYFLLYTIHTVY